VSVGPGKVSERLSTEVPSASFVSGKRSSCRRASASSSRAARSRLTPSVSRPTVIPTVRRRSARYDARSSGR